MAALKSLPDEPQPRWPDCSLASPAFQEADELQSSSWQHWGLCDGHTPVLPPESGHPDPWHRGVTPRGSAPGMGTWGTQGTWLWLLWGHAWDWE